MRAERLVVAWRRDLWPLLLILASLLPFVAYYLFHLWRTKPHYQFFPLLLIGCGVLFWRRWPRSVGRIRPSWFASLWWTAGLFFLISAVLLPSPWLAGIATLLTVAGVLLWLQGHGTWRDWFPVWAILWLVIPPPLGWDLPFIQRLQLSTSRGASWILDAWGVQHLMEGNVLVVPGHRLLVDEACSGVNSTFVLLAATALFVVAYRRPLLWAGLMLLGSVVWSALSNIVRVVAVAVAQTWYGLDWSSGWQHEVLGFCTLGFAIGMLVSLDRFLAFFLGPVAPFEDGPDAPLLAWDGRVNWVTRVWNRCAGWHDPAGARLPQPDSCASTGGSGPRNPGAEWWSRWFAAGFAATAVVPVVIGFLPTPVHDEPREIVLDEGRANLFEQTDLPATLAGWTQVGYTTEEHERAMAPFRHLWHYQDVSIECLVAVDYPFRGWHDLTRCYEGAGWQVVERQRWIADAATGQASEPYIEAQLSKPGWERGLLLFCNVSRFSGETLDDYLGSPWQRTVQRIQQQPSVAPRRSAWCSRCGRSAPDPSHIVVGGNLVGFAAASCSPAVSGGPRRIVDGPRYQVGRARRMTNNKDRGFDKLAEEFELYEGRGRFWPYFIPFVWGWWYTRCWLALFASLPGVIAGGTLVVFLVLGCWTPNDRLMELYQVSADAALSQGDGAAAELYFRRLIALNATSPAVRYGIALTAALQGDPARARTLMRALAPEDTGGYPQAHRWVAQDLISRDGGLTPESAQIVEHHLSQVLAHDKTNREAVALMAAVLWSRGDKEKALPYVEQMARESPEWNLPLAALHQTQRDPVSARRAAQRAAAHYRERVLSDPQAWSDRLRWAQSEAMQENYSQAATILRAGLAASDPQPFHDALVEVYLAWYAATPAETPEGLATRVELLNQALTHDPSHPRVLTLVAELSSRDGEQGEMARQALQEALADGKSTGDRSSDPGHPGAGGG
jgi:exosortase